MLIEFINANYCTIIEENNPLFLLFEFLHPIKTDGNIPAEYQDIFSTITNREVSCITSQNIGGFMEGDGNFSAYIVSNNIRYKFNWTYQSGQIILSDNINDFYHEIIID